MKITEKQLRKIIRESIKNVIYDSYPKPKVRVSVKMASRPVMSENLNLEKIMVLYNQIPEEKRIPNENINFPVFDGVHTRSVNDWCALVNVIVCLCNDSRQIESLLNDVLTLGEEPFHVQAKMQKGRKFQATNAGPVQDIEQNVQFITAEIYSDNPARKRLTDIGWPIGKIQILIYDESDSREVNFHHGR